MSEKEKVLETEQGGQTCVVCILMAYIAYIDVL